MLLIILWLCTHIYLCNCLYELNTVVVITSLLFLYAYPSLIYKFPMNLDTPSACCCMYGVFQKGIQCLFTWLPYNSCYMWMFSFHPILFIHTLFCTVIIKFLQIKKKKIKNQEKQEKSNKNWRQKKTKISSTKVGWFESKNMGSLMKFRGSWIFW